MLLGSSVSFIFHSHLFVTIWCFLFFFPSLLQLCFPKRKVYQKLSLYLHKAGVRSTYILPPQTFTRGIILGGLLLLIFPKQKKVCPIYKGFMNAELSDLFGTYLSRVRWFFLISFGGQSYSVFAATRKVPA